MFTIRVLGKNIKNYFVELDGEKFFRFKLWEKFNSDNGNKENILEFTFTGEWKIGNDLTVLRMKK